jgi:hypothetical protein
VRRRVAAELQRRLRGCPLLLNLEGVLSEDGRAGHALQLAMPADHTLRRLRELGVVAVSLANNHSRDLGDAAYAAMAARLREAGLQVLEHGVPQQLGPLRIVAFSDLDNTPVPRAALLTPQALRAALATPADLAFMHWGREFSAAPGARERELAQALQAAGVTMVVGAHPHRASAGIRLLGGLDAVWVPSLGNFIFDQRAPRASGAVLQISRFAQGTHALRLIPLPDVFELGRPPPLPQNQAPSKPLS